MDYASLVLQFLEQGKYVVLEEYVLLDVYYKMIPTDYTSTSVQRFDRHHFHPEDVYIRNAQPFSLHYLVSQNPHHFTLHRVHTLDTQPFPLKCITVKLARSFLDRAIFHSRSASFEEELYRFITFLNTDVPRLASVLNLKYTASTRFLPQRLQLWPFHYTVRTLVPEPLSEAERSCFGPPPLPETLPIRTLVGRLAACTSRATLLSLHNPLDHPRLTYLHHYSEQWNTLVPLAFNPLENPIIGTG